MFRQLSRTDQDLCVQHATTTPGLPLPELFDVALDRTRCSRFRVRQPRARGAAAAPKAGTGRAGGAASPRLAS
jgi:hypothetical protein